MMNHATQPACPHETLAASLAYSACLGAGEWLLALTQIDPQDAPHGDEIADDMARSARLFAPALLAFDDLARGPLDLQRREQVEHLRQDVVALLEADGIDAFFEEDAAEIVRQPLDLAPHAMAGEVRQ